MPQYFVEVVIMSLMVQQTGDWEKLDLEFFGFDCAILERMNRSNDGASNLQEFSSSLILKVHWEDHQIAPREGPHRR